MRKFAHLALAALVALTIAAATTMWGTWRATQQVPEFYERALAAPPAIQRAAGQQFERQALALHNTIRRPGRWEARFSEEHINGWLASDLPQKFPKAMPRGVSDPRVALDEGRGKVAVRYEKGDMKTVVSLDGEAYLTEEPNEVAIRIDAVRAGSLPVPLQQFLETIAKRATNAGFPLRWTEIEGDPVALVKVPLDPSEFRGRRLLIEELRLTDEELVVAGRTEDGQPMDDEEPLLEEFQEETPSPAVAGHEGDVHPLPAKAAAIQAKPRTTRQR
jgi:hypothetical protein